MNPLVIDEVIAGGPDDFQQVRHLVLRGAQRDIGRALGAVARDDLGVNKTARWSDPEATEAHAAWLAEHWPEHHQRSLGAADAFCADPADRDQDFSFLHYNWAVPGCSNCFYPPATTADGHAILSRNYDFTTGTVFELTGRPSPPGAPAATARPFVIETHPDDGYSTLTLTSYELLGGALDGINGAGLGVALMATVEVLRGGGSAPLNRNGVGLNEIQLLRFLLERAGTAAEARRLLETLPQYTMWVPCHFMIADAGGDSFLWSNDIGPAPVRIEGKSDHPLCATNHLPEHPFAAIDERAESEDRLARLQRAVAAARGDGGGATRSGIIDASRAVAATSPPGAGQYQAASPARTLWHAVYDLEERSVAVDFYLGEGAAGGVRRSPFVDFALVGAQAS